MHLLVVVLILNYVFAAVSHQRVLIGRDHDRITIGANGPKQTKVLNEQNLYEASEHYLLTEQQLKDNSWVQQTQLSVGF